MIGRKIIHYNQVTSTNDIIREWAELGEADGLVVTAEEQTQGRGRLGRKWVVPSGTSVQLSALLRPPLAPLDAHRLTQMAALALTATLRELVRAKGGSPPAAVALKWPNDVLLNGKKCAGILAETGIAAEWLAFAILGIGLNVNYSMRDYTELAPFATTLADELGHPVNRDALEEALLAELDAYYARLCAGDDFLTEWRGQLTTLGRAVRVATSSGIEEGIAQDVDTDGALLLRQGERVLRLYAGDVTLLKD